MSGGEDEESVFWPTNKRGYELQALVGEVREGGWGVAGKGGKGLLWAWGQHMRPGLAPLFT
jgi:hypothetical protein